MGEYSKNKIFGASKCHLCGLQEEMMEHLLNLYPFTSTVWDWVASVFRQTDRDRIKIINTLKNWMKEFSNNEIINKAWTLVSGFII